MKLYNTISSKLLEFNQMIDSIKLKNTPTLIVGLSNIHKTHFIYSASVQLDTPILVICDDESTANKMCEDLNIMSSSQQDIAYVYPARDFEFRQIESVSKEYEEIRIGVLSRILDKSCKICFCSIDAVLQHTIPKDELLNKTFTIDFNKTYNIDDIVRKLVQAGYTKRDQVDGIAQFSLRGGILDIFPPNRKNPVRIEFWDDEIDMMVEFDIETQRRIDTSSDNMILNVTIIPAREVLFDSACELKEKIIKLKDITKNSIAKEKLQSDILRLDNELELYNIDKYLSLIYNQSCTILDYFNLDTTVFVDEYISIKERAKNFLWQYSEDLKILFENGELCNGLDNFYDEFFQFQHKLSKFCQIYTDTFAHSSSDIKYKNIISLNPIQTSSFSGNLKILKEDLDSLLELDYTVVVLSGTEKSGITLSDDLSKMGFNSEYVSDLTTLTPKKVFVLSGNISSGFEYPDIKFSLISTNRSHQVKTRKTIYKKGKTIRSLEDLIKGDLVVHISHGIGIFDGIHQMNIHNVIKDYIKIKYAGADTLYVPVTQMDLISKYIGPKDDGRIKLNKLNSGEWQKTKSRVKKACADMADELIALYSKRMKIKGHAFTKDTPWQKEFEDRFPYTETEDQLRCIEEIKKDMEKINPMDRLLCGDVGFGKTEVALRAVFKCVMDSKQCAILCPTTILAWQHYQNAIKRFEGYPIKIELMSRFRTTKQIKETLKKLKTGEVDIVIGTHRIIQKDVEFANLGLAIIDEEQRFGVAHKERFKEMFTSVDMLTLSATPIPRTLNMAMSGIRDMSTIEQAPQDRQPVQTYVLEHDMGIIIEAIKKELKRNGQVYYIHNRVETINLCASKIGTLLPNANIGIAHGKMNEQELSQVWKQLINYEIDILVCTTLIETGVDVKNCNTLIIENADHMGLSQLYQLRGRVGRSNRRAFAYFTFEKGKALTEISTKRLNAIREFISFGSGFRIALRDLEIRGAGSILGGKQHGHMEAVGYDMYVRLLNEAIATKKGKEPEQKSYECLIDIQVNAHIPEKYIENLSQRLDIYKKIASIKTKADKMELLDELFDRFGNIPKTVETLLDISLIRNTLSNFGFKEISQKSNSIMLIVEQLNMDIATTLMANMKGRVLVNASSKPYITVKFNKNSNVVDTLQEIFNVLVKE